MNSIGFQQRRVIANTNKKFIFLYYTKASEGLSCGHPQPFPDKSSFLNLTSTSELKLQPLIHIGHCDRCPMPYNFAIVVQPGGYINCNWHTLLSYICIIWQL